MPPRFALRRRSVPPFGLGLAAFVWLSSPLAGQELPLLRDYPGSGRYQCPAPIDVVPPDEDAALRGAQLASDANQAIVLGDLERSQQLLAQAVALDPSSADFAFRHALALAEIGDSDNALTEYCRAVDLDEDGTLDALDVRGRIDDLYERVRERIPEAARDAFVQGLAEADSSSFEDAVESFSTAIEAAPEWGAPIYNRGVVYEQLGRIGASLTDYRRYLELAPTDIDPLLVLVSERIGQLEGAASVETPSPAGAFALGIVPGMGHYYSGRPLVGTVTLATAGGALAAGIMFRNITTLCVAEVPPGSACPDNLVVAEVTERPYLWYGVGVAAVVTVVGALDALLKAKRRRAEADAIAGPPRPSGVDDRGSAFMAVEGPSLTGTEGRVDLNLVTLRFR